jgi:hypothetical protein
MLPAKPVNRLERNQANMLPSVRTAMALAAPLTSKDSLHFHSHAAHAQVMDIPSLILVARAVANHAYNNTKQWP